MRDCLHAVHNHGAWCLFMVLMLVTCEQCSFLGVTLVADHGGSVTPGDTCGRAVTSLLETLTWRGNLPAIE